MKSPILKMKKGVKINGVKKLRLELNELITDSFADIRPYIVNDLLKLLKKKGIVYAESKKKNKKKAKKTK